MTHRQIGKVLGMHAFDVAKVELRAIQKIRRALSGEFPELKKYLVGKPRIMHK